MRYIEHFDLMKINERVTFISSIVKADFSAEEAPVNFVSKLLGEQPHKINGEQASIDVVVHCTNDQEVRFGLCPCDCFFKPIQNIWKVKQNCAKVSKIAKAILISVHCKSDGMKGGIDVFEVGMTQEPSKLRWY
jgi:hypothetical protein